MSYLRGTKVRLQADFTDTETGEPFDPVEVILTIEQGDGVVVQRTLTNGQVINDTERVGRFYYVLDTEPAPGTWTYQFASTGNQAALGRKTLTVIERLVAVP